MFSAISFQFFPLVFFPRPNLFFFAVENNSNFYFYLILITVL